LKEIPKFHFIIRLESCKVLGPLVTITRPQSDLLPKHTLGILSFLCILWIVTKLLNLYCQWRFYLKLKLSFVMFLTYRIRFQCLYMNFNNKWKKSNMYIWKYLHIFFIKCKVAFQTTLMHPFWTKLLNIIKMLHFKFAITLISHQFAVFFIAPLLFVCAQCLFVKTFQCNKQCYK